MDQQLRDRLITMIGCCGNNTELAHTALKFIVDRELTAEFVDHMERALDPGYYERDVMSQVDQDQFMKELERMDEKETLDTLIQQDQLDSHDAYAVMYGGPTHEEEEAFLKELKAL